MAECLQYEAESSTPDVVFVRPKQARLLQGGPARIVTTALREMDTTVTRLANCKVKAEFEAVREKVFPDYINLAYIIANSFSIGRDQSIRRTAVYQAIRAVENYLQASGIERFGPDVIREAIFCLDTLRRAYHLVAVIYDSDSKAELGQEARETDRKLANRFNVSALWSQFHLDCLRVIIAKHTIQAQEVIDEVLLGSRLSVMAYSYARQAVKLRSKEETFLLDTARDEEDVELLKESLSDYIEHESSIDAEPHS